MSDPSLSKKSSRKPAGPAPARLRKAERERKLMANLNAGISIAEIAAVDGVSERRIRQRVQEVLARRAPRPPAEYVALQVSRLNEALLVAYSAMGGQNLEAVDRVVKIVRELDRYHGLAAPDFLREPSVARHLPKPRAPLALPLRETARESEDNSARTP